MDILLLLLHILCLSVVCVCVCVYHVVQVDVGSSPDELLDYLYAALL